MGLKKETTTEILLKMKETVEQDKIEVHKLQGQLAEQMKQLSASGYKDIPAAEKALAAINVEIARLDKHINEGIAQLKEDYGL